MCVLRNSYFFAFRAQSLTTLTSSNVPKYILMYKLCSLKVPYQKCSTIYAFNTIEIISSLDFDICYQYVTTYLCISHILSESFTSKYAVQFGLLKTMLK